MCKTTDLHPIKYRKVAIKIFGEYSLLSRWGFAMQPRVAAHLVPLHWPPGARVIGACRLPPPPFQCSWCIFIQMDVSIYCVAGLVASSWGQLVFWPFLSAALAVFIPLSIRYLTWWSVFCTSRFLAWGFLNPSVFPTKSIYILQNLLSSTLYFIGHLWLCLLMV